jgi:hypothetical protein
MEFDPNAHTGPLVLYCERHEVHYLTDTPEAAQHGTDKCDADQLASCEAWRAGKIATSCAGKGKRCTHKGINTITVHHDVTGKLEAVYTASSESSAYDYARTLADEFGEAFHVRNRSGAIIATMRPMGAARALSRGDS